MSSLVVVTNSASKTLTATGVVSVGESVSVSLEGLSAVTTARFRVVDEAGKDLARFPLADTDAWTVSGDDLTATVDFDTDKLRKAFEGVAFRDKMRLGIIVDTTDGTQVARGTFYVLQWACASDEEPTVLPDVKELLEEAKAAASSAAASATAAAGSAAAATASATAAAGSANDAAAQVNEAAKYAGAAQEAAAAAKVDVEAETKRAMAAEALKSDIGHKHDASDINATTEDNDKVLKVVDGKAQWAAGGGGTPEDYETVKANALAGKEHADITSGNPHGTTATDVGVPTWAQATTKPTYTAAEVGALPDTTAYLASATKDTSSTAETKLTITPSKGDAVTVSVPNKDTSLTVDGAYADAKTVGEKLALHATVADLGNGVFRISDNVVDTTSTKVLY